jgi:hypothetical protein
MSVTYIGLDAENPRTTKIGTGGIVTSERVHLFSTDTPGDNESTIYAHGNCPKFGSVHPDTATMWCVDVEIINHAPYSGWRVTASYSSEREQAEDPLDDPAIVGPWDSDSYQEVAEVDTNDELILNSAGDPFDPPLMKDFSRRNVTVRKNVAAVPSWFLDYEDAVNSDVFTVGGLSIQVGKAKCKKTGVSEKKTRNGIDYYEVTTLIHFSKKGWKRRVLDVGFRQLSDDGLSRVKITVMSDADPPEAENVSAPVPLDGAGRVLADPTPATATYLEYDLDDSLPFSVLPLS